MGISIKDFDKCCRCCLVMVDDMKPLFGACLNVMFTKMMNIQVTPIDGYPQQMCPRCILKLSSAYTFYITVLRNQKTLEEILEAAVDNGELPALKASCGEEKELNTPEQDVTTQEESLVYKATCIQPFSAPKEDIKTKHKSTPAINSSRKVDHGRRSDSGSEDVSDNEESYQCSQCKYSSKNEEQLKIHLQTHVGVNRVNSGEADVYAQLCNICGAGFRWRTSLHKHLRQHARGGRRCPHPHCARTFPEAATLNVHLVSHSSDPKPYRCSQCPRSFTQQSSRNKHARQHDTRPLLPCDQCDKSFLHKYSLQRHRDSAHSFHECPACNRFFTGKKFLDMHMRYHKKDETDESKTERPTDNALIESINIQAVTVEFLCLLCTTKFQTRESLEVHNCSKERIS